MPSFKAGSSTSGPTANVLGVSRPKGMAVTSRAAGPPGQAERHPGIDQVAEHDAQGRAGDHLRQHELPREALLGGRVRAGHQHHQHDHHGHVVEDQAEEGVQVAPTGPHGNGS